MCFLAQFNDSWVWALQFLLALGLCPICGGGAGRGISKDVSERRGIYILIGVVYISFLSCARKEGSSLVFLKKITGSVAGIQG